MGDALVTAQRSARIQERLHNRKNTDPNDEAVLRRLRRDAASAGATLATGGKGGLPPTLVRDVMRRDEFRCKACGTNQKLIVHHKGGLEAPVSRWLATKGKSNDPNNIVTLCTTCHDSIHDEDRARL